MCDIIWQCEGQTFISYVDHVTPTTIYSHQMIIGRLGIYVNIMRTQRSFDLKINVIILEQINKPNLWLLNDIKKKTTQLRQI